MRGDLASRQPLGAQRQHHRVDAFEAALPLADRARLERAVPISGNIEVDRTDIGQHRLGARPVAGVAAVAALDRVLLIAEMLGHLDLEARSPAPAW